MHLLSGMHGTGGNWGASEGSNIECVNYVTSRIRRHMKDVSLKLKFSVAN